MAQPIPVTDAAFEQTVLKSKTPVIVDFWAPWCPPCRAIAPMLESLAAEYDGQVIVAKVNTDEDPEWSQRYGVLGIPTMLFIRDGKLVEQVVGARPYPAIKRSLDAMLSAVPA